MKEAFIDSEHKIIVSCPHCDSQERMYLLNALRKKESIVILYCYGCEKYYAVSLEITLTCKTKTYSCEEVKDEI